MKTIVILSLGIYTSNYLRKQLEDILTQGINIISYSLETYIPKEIECDLIVFSSPEAKRCILNNINTKSKYIVVKRSISNVVIDDLINIERGKDILVVNDTKGSCEQIIKQLRSHGIDQINYYPYYPGIDNFKKLDIAITPGESSLVPRDVKQIIDIGTRAMDIISIWEIVNELGMKREYEERISSTFSKNMVATSKKYINIANKSIELTHIMKDILDNSNEGIIYTNIEGEVLVLNELALEVLNINKKEIISTNIYSNFPELNNDIVNINGKDLFISKKNLYKNEKIIGNIITMENISQIEKRDDEIRRKSKINKNYAKYTFNDMIGSSNTSIRNIELAKSISKTNSTVLIQGETGTGKEILAQAIHNYSGRSNYPFIAVNFAALPENLLESELFGYEDGAFTGAKKGGKIGLFKRAHKGTIFLDEIGDAPYHFQARLLRVLQEKEVTPIGSTEPIPIDIRVIAATNKDLTEYVTCGKFREDLFYRLNVMPIYTIPIRDRKEEIQEILKYYMKKNNVFRPLNEFISDEAMYYLLNYSWPGNIREIINIVEYLINIKKEKLIAIKDLPIYMHRNITTLNLNVDKSYKTDIDKDMIWILSKIDEYNCIGRRTICEIAKSENKKLGETRIKNYLNKLKNEEFIKVNKGSRGCEILERGKCFLEANFK